MTSRLFEEKEWEYLLEKIEELKAERNEYRKDAERLRETFLRPINEKILESAPASFNIDNIDQIMFCDFNEEANPTDDHTQLKVEYVFKIKNPIWKMEV